jgi:hypothetical protein
VGTFYRVLKSRFVVCWVKSDKEAFADESVVAYGYFVAFLPFSGFYEDGKYTDYRVV